MSDQKQVERVCRALGIKPEMLCTDGVDSATHDIPCEKDACKRWDNGVCSKRNFCGEETSLEVNYPEGPDLLAALKEKLVEKDIWFYTGRNNKANDGKWYAEVMSGGFVRGPDTELDALLAACEQAFCKKEDS